MDKLDRNLSCFVKGLLSTLGVFFVWVTIAAMVSKGPVGGYFWAMFWFLVFAGLWLAALFFLTAPRFSLSIAMAVAFLHRRSEAEAIFRLGQIQVLLNWRHLVRQKGPPGLLQNFREPLPGSLMRVDESRAVETANPSEDQSQDQ